MKCLPGLSLSFALLLLTCDAGLASSVTSNVVASGSCSPVVPDGCQARSVYVTGDGSGGTIHTVDFNSGAFTDPFGIASYAGGAAIDGGAPPTGDTTHWMGISSATETITFSAPIDYFGLYWGSVDSGNTVTIKNGASTLLTFTGSQITGSAAYVSFNGTFGNTWDTVVLSYSSLAFESDSHAYVLAASGAPEPGTLSTVPSVVLAGGLAFWYRRRKRASAAGRG